MGGEGYTTAVGEWCERVWRHVKNRKPRGESDNFEEELKNVPMEF
jgi:hypothetical protein